MHVKMRVWYIITQKLASTLVIYLQISVAMKLTQCWEVEEEEEEEGEEDGKIIK